EPGDLGQRPGHMGRLAHRLHRKDEGESPRLEDRHVLEVAQDQFQVPHPFRLLSGSRDVIRYQVYAGEPDGGIASRQANEVEAIAAAELENAARSQPGELGLHEVGLAVVAAVVRFVAKRQGEMESALGTMEQSVPLVALTVVLDHVVLTDG